MLKIYKDGKSLIVTNGSFHNQYRHVGWTTTEELSTEETIVEEMVEESELMLESESEESEWDEQEAVDELEEKPLSEMNRDELIAFATLKNVNIEGLAKNVQIRDAIKNSLK